MSVIVITGASGFLGRNVSQALVARGRSIIQVSRQPNSAMTQVSDYSESPDGDCLIHLAEQPDRGLVNRQGEDYVIASARVVSALSKRFGSRMIYASSGTVYGDQSEMPFTVESPVLTTDIYSKSKLCNEDIVLSSGAKVVRISNLFGVGMSENNVLSDIIRQLPEDGPIRVRNDRVWRDFIPASQVADLFALLVESSFCGVLNAGSGIPTSVRELAEIILDLAGQQGRQIVASGSSSAPSKNVLDVSKTKKLFGWPAVNNLADQLREFLLDNGNLTHG